MEKYCPSCGQANPANAAFCRQCATSLAGAASAPTQQQSPPSQQWNPPIGGPVMGSSQQQMQSSAANNRPMIAVILVVVGLLCCGPFTSVPGAVMGWMEMNAINEGRSPQSNKMMAQIALWGGIGVTIFTIIGWILFFVMSALSGGGRYY